MPRLLFIALLTLAGCALSRAAEIPGVTLVWNYNPTNEPVVGYKIYQDTISRTNPAWPGFYALTRDAGKTNSTWVPIMPGGTNYFAITAYDNEGLESGYSAEVTYTSTNSGSVFLTVPRLVTVTNGVPVNPPTNAVDGVLFTVQFRPGVATFPISTLTVFVPDGGDFYATASALPMKSVPKSYVVPQTKPRSPVSIMPPSPKSAVKKIVPLSGKARER